MSGLSALKNLFSAQLERSVLLQRWRALIPRERLALSLLVLFLLALLLYLSLWRPAEQRLIAARSAYEQQRELSAYLQARAPLARELHSKPKVSLDPANLQGLITASAAQQNLAVERLDTEGDGGLQVSLQPAPFAQLLRWFALLEGQGVRIDEAGLDRDEDGRVAARLMLRVAH
ncbi:type II secretion system protein M [Pseudomonas cavernicola]|uniref:Type II secretion system protein M n=1 Tax=Pseudomonas cavernicola TaxID=2320866 RepID=A0A418XMT9_9PSED|nr:type II secretion system protein M [Pseudomonas cavernicola]RJG13773.1 type II secretion system protein M [Pseudomonas cavernicola]